MSNEKRFYTAEEVRREMLVLSRKSAMETSSRRAELMLEQLATMLEHEQGEAVAWIDRSNVPHGTVSDEQLFVVFSEAAETVAKRSGLPLTNNSPIAAVAAIQFALTADDGFAWLWLWNGGEFDACRREWPEAPEDCYVGADPMLSISSADTEHKEKGDER